MKILKTISLAGLLTLGACEPQEVKQKSIETIQQELLEVEWYIQAIENPAAFDGVYSLGWTMKVPEKYETFCRNYKKL